MNREEESVRDFYDRYGWVVKAGVSGEDALFRQFCDAYYPYHELVNARTMACFTDLGRRLLVAGGGDMPETHVTIANQFPETTCLDISKLAIEIARKKLDNRGEFLVGSILEIPKGADHFDAVYCPHVIYHIAKDLQGRAVRELIRVTRPGGRIVIVYANWRSLPSRIENWKGRLPLLRKLRRKAARPQPNMAELQSLYVFAHPLEWWTQFADTCKVELRPWDVMSSDQEEALLINDRVASLGYWFCAWFESRYPNRAARWWRYPLIVLTKKQAARPH